MDRKGRELGIRLALTPGNNHMLIYQKEGRSVWRSQETAGLTRERRAAKGKRRIIR